MRILAPQLSMKTSVAFGCSCSSPDRRFRIHTASFVAGHAAMYSASVDDVAVVACFFDIQDTSPDPREKQYPDTDCQVSGQFA